MQLSQDRDCLIALDEPSLTAAILERRSAIRSHRDQRGDNRCWVDDYTVWMFVEGLVTAPLVPFDYVAVMQNCHQFYHCRRADQPDPMPVDAIMNPVHWDDDLASMSTSPASGPSRVHPGSHRDAQPGSERRYTGYGR